MNGNGEQVHARGLGPSRAAYPGSILGSELALGLVAARCAAAKPSLVVALSCLVSRSVPRKVVNLSVACEARKLGRVDCMLIGTSVSFS